MSGIKTQNGPQYHNPNSLVHLIGRGNEAEVVVEVIQILTLIDFEAQVSTIAKGFVSNRNYILIPWIDS